MTSHCTREAWMPLWSVDQVGIAVCLHMLLRTCCSIAEKTQCRDKSRLNSVYCAGYHANYELQRVVFVLSCSFHRQLPTTPLREVDNDILCLDGKRLLSTSDALILNCHQSASGGRTYTNVRAVVLR